MAFSDVFCIVMAGGSGTRFWPQSREEKAKQFLPILDDNSLITNTLQRFHKSMPWENIYIISKENQNKELMQHATEVPAQNIVYEPMAKNTAPCIGLGTLMVQQKETDGVIIVTPADHRIEKEEAFLQAIEASVELAKEHDGIVTLGITPNRPATGYGYIQIDEPEKRVKGVKSYQVKTFAEKPNLETAERFLSSGDFFWNSGIFIFRASVMMAALEEYLPDLYDGLQELKPHLGQPSFSHELRRIYQQIKSISIDYGIMEKYKNVFLVRGDFVWSDLGSWDQVFILSDVDEKGNSVQGNAVLVDSQGSFVQADNDLVALVGVDDLIVVKEGNAILICRRGRSQDVKLVVEKLKRKKMVDYF